MWLDRCEHIKVQVRGFFKEGDKSANKTYGWNDAEDQKAVSGRNPFGQHRAAHRIETAIR